MAAISFPFKARSELQRLPSEEMSLKEFNKNAFSIAAICVMSMMYPVKTAVGVTLNGIVSQLSREKIPFTIQMMMLSSAALITSPPIVESGLAAAQLASSGVLTGYQMASSGVLAGYQAASDAAEFVINNPDRVIKIALDTLGQAIPHLTVPAILFTAVALRQPKPNV